MALVIEDGSVVSGANSYISVIAAQAYLDARGLTSTITEALLLRAVDTMAGLNWRGLIVDQEQEMDWPRAGVYDCNGRYVDTDTVPAAIGYAQAYIAYHIYSGNDPEALAENKVTQETVDVITVKYSDKGSSKENVSLSDLPQVKNLIRCYLSSTTYLYHA